MGICYQHVGKFLRGEFTGEIFLELGSDRFEGSSQYFADLAFQHRGKFITVDLDKEAISRAIRVVPTKHKTNAEFIHCEAVRWCRENLPTYNTKVKVVYLDNFDWNWSTNKHSEMIAKQQIWYREQGIDMNNLNSQVSHLAQIQAILPYMSDQSIVCVDDTYEYNGVYIGKGGAVVPYLIANGFEILVSGDYGIILGRNTVNYTV